MKLYKIDSRKIPSEGETSILIIGEKEYCIAMHESSLSVFDNLCPHAGASLGLGEIKDGLIFCPLHQFNFNLKTGACSVERFALHHHQIVEKDGEYYIQLLDSK
jgi:nitrite reductase/ring-hydroxylating ferredoxin subunit